MEGALVAITMVAAGDITKVTTRVVAEVVAMEETVMTATVMVSVVGCLEFSGFKMWFINTLRYFR